MASPCYLPASDASCCFHVLFILCQEVQSCQPGTQGSLCGAQIFQRQLSKEGLQALVNADDAGGSNLLSAEDLRDLFTLRPYTASDTFESMCEEDDNTAEDPSQSLPPINSSADAPQQALSIHKEQVNKNVPKLHPTRLIWDVRRVRIIRKRKRQQVVELCSTCHYPEK